MLANLLGWFAAAVCCSIAIFWIERKCHTSQLHIADTAATEHSSTALTIYCLAVNTVWVPMLGESLLKTILGLLHMAYLV